MGRVGHGEPDQVFTFEIVQTSGQEESAGVRKGFRVSFPRFCAVVFLLTRLAPATQR